MTHHIKYSLAGALVIMVTLAALWSLGPSYLLGKQQQRNDNLLAEEMAYHTGVMAYIYGFPVVDMLTQMHNETHRVAPDQPVYAPVNRFFRFPGLVTPDNSGNLRAPNADTLYYTAWYDVTQQPVILSVPDTHGRYYTIAVTNLYSEVQHIGRRTTGTSARQFALVAPEWEGQLPEGVEPFPVSTTRGWLLGRMYVAGPTDLQEAEMLVAQIRLTPLADWPSFTEATTNTSYDYGWPPGEIATEMDPYTSLAYFSVFDRALRDLPARAGEAALIDQFRRIGIGGTHPFDPDALSPSTKKGLERALEDGQHLVTVATRRSVESFNGWMISKKIGRYGFDYLHRASVAKGGYGNLPEESLYPAAVFDAYGDLLSGSNRYQITFPAGGLPPVTAFWSLAAYDLWNLRMTSNELDRYVIGDRTEGLQYNHDGSLTVFLQHDRPKQGTSNWLPIPEGHFMLVMRLYEPSAAALDHRWVPPIIEPLE